MDVLLVSPVFIRSVTNISNNLNDKYLQSAIREATDVDYEEIVGSKMLYKLKSLIDTDEIELDENINYKNLLEASKYFLAYSAIARIVVISSVKLDNSGANTAQDEYVNNLELDEIMQLEKYYTNKVDAYRYRLQNYIRKNIKVLPEIESECCFETPANLTAAASTSIWLGGERGKCCKRYHTNRLAEKYEYSDIRL